MHGVVGVNTEIVIDLLDFKRQSRLKLGQRSHLGD